MAVSGVNTYKDAVFQWQSQQLKSTGQSSSSSSSAASSLLSNQSMTNQIASLVELTKYAMDAMGATSSNSRVTFSQITKYRQQLQTEFNQSVKAGLMQSGISNIEGLSFSLDKNGLLNAIGTNAADRKKAQAWLDANPDFGKSLRSSLDSANFEDEVTFTISSTGKLTVNNSTQSAIQQELDKASELTSTLRSALEEIGISQKTAIDFKLVDGHILATGENADQINKWLNENSELEAAVLSQLEKYGLDESAISLRLGSTGNIQVSVSDMKVKDAQAVFDTASETGKKIRTGLENIGIDPNVSFSIQINDDGSASIISSHPDADKIQAFFDEHPELIKKYRQIETLAGIDDARKAMQLSPTTMRKRVQIESMMSWWAGSSDSTSYFGNYSSGSLSLYSGLNMNV